MRADRVAGIAGLITAASLLAAFPANAQLKAGDVAIVAYNSDGTDDFAFVTMRTIPANTVLNFTDSSVSNGNFRWTEHLGEFAPGPLTWSCGDAIPAGTVVRWMASGQTNWSVGQYSGGRPKFNADGDQIIVYTGTIVSNADLTWPWRGDPSGAVMIHAINFANGGWNNVTGGQPTDSFVPPGLSTTGFTAVYTDNKDNGYYGGPCTGTACQLRRAVADPVNWTTANDPFPQSLWPVLFRVTPEGTICTWH